MKKKKHKTGSSLHDYFESLDFISWWEDFTQSFTENGQLKYFSVSAFIKAKTKDVKKREFLWWILGKKVNDGEIPRNKDFAKYPQFDWDAQREKGFWYSNSNIENIKLAASNKMSSIEEVRAIGKFNLDDMGRIKALCDQLDREFGGRLNLPGLSAKENVLRLTNYLHLRQTLQSQLHNAQSMFAKTRSVDMDALEGVLSVIGPTLLGTVANADKQLAPEIQQKVDLFESLTSMQMKKAAKWQMELPDRAMQQAVNGKTITIDKKKAVQ